jgi:hypothetical protein
MSSPSLAAAWWILSFFVWGSTVYLFLHIRRNRASLAADRRAQEFADWARWTMFSVTDRNGMVWCETLHQMWETGTPERVWADPIAVAVWTAEHSGPLASWQREALDMFGNTPQGDGS